MTRGVSPPTKEPTTTTTTPAPWIGKSSASMVDSSELRGLSADRIRSRRIVIYSRGHRSRSTMIYGLPLDVWPTTADESAIIPTESRRAITSGLFQPKSRSNPQISRIRSDAAQLCCVCATMIKPVHFCDLEDHCLSDLLGCRRRNVMVTIWRSQSLYGRHCVIFYYWSRDKQI